jgi:4-amino-4-deoxy-L-arabinose transferase-like glycosyltransferase
MKRTSLSLTALALLWAMLVLGLYYWVHKPVTPPLAGALGGALLDGAVAGAFALVGAGVGRGILRRGDLLWGSAPEQIAAAGAVGLPVLSLLLLAVGSLALSGWSVAATLVIIGALTGRGTLAWARQVAGWLRAPLPPGRWARFLAAITLGLAGLALILALLPPSKWDALAYHLAGPQQYVARGRFYAEPHNHFLGFPQIVETLFAGQLALTGRLTGAAVLHWGMGALLLLAVGGRAARLGGAITGWLAAAILLGAQTVWIEMSIPYVDLLPMLLAVVGLGAAERWDEARQSGQKAPLPGPFPDRAREGESAALSGQVPLSSSAGEGDLGGEAEALSSLPGLRHAILLGTLAGFSIGVKYSALWLVIAFGVLLLWRGRGSGWRATLAYAAVYALAALLAFAPWLLRNALFYGNPVYPFVFESAEMDAIRQGWYSQPRSGLIYGESAWQIPLLPLTATVLGVEGAGIYGTDIGPLFLLLIPLLALARGRLAPSERAWLSLAGVVTGVILAAWLVSGAFGSYISLQTRLVLYVFGPLAIVAALTLRGLERLPPKPLHLGFVIQALVALAVALTGVAALRYAGERRILLYFSGEEGYERAYLEHALGWHYATMQRVNALPSGATVRFLWEPRALYCDGERLRCIPDSLMDGWYYARRTVGQGKPAEVATRWQAEGADYLLVYEFGRAYEREHAALYDPADWLAWEAFSGKFLDEVWRTGTPGDDVQYILYRWRES